MVNVAALLETDLHQVVDAICSADLDELCGAELAAAAIQIQRERDRLSAVAARIFDRWDASGMWALDGSRSAASRLARDAHCSTRNARNEIRRARSSRHMPQAVAAVLAGELSMDHLDLLASALTPSRRELFARDESLLVDQCRTLTFADAAQAIKYWCQRADAEVADTDSEESPDIAGHVHVSTTFNDNVVITGELDPVRGSIFAQELARLEREIYLADTAAGISRPTSQRQAEALTQMAIRSASTPADAKRPRPLFTVLLGDESFRHLCELANGTVLPPALLGRWMGDADLETVLFDGPSTVISVSHRRTFTGALRRAIEVRDRRCTHPSVCDVPADRCDVDHIIPVADHGPTSQFNGRMQCPTHNRNSAKHDHGASPYPPRSIGLLDHLRGRLRWQILNSDP
jgi:hypothetical protein